MKKANLVLCALGASLSGVAIAFPVVSDVTMEQVGGKVVIGYTLNEPAIVTVDVLTNALDGAGVSVGAVNLAGLKGDVFNYVSAGHHVIEWRPRKTPLGESGFKATDGSVRAEVTAWSTNCPPDYLVVDLTKTVTDKWAAARFYPSADWVPGGVTENPAYRRTHLLMRKVPAAGVEWRMGSAQGEPSRTPGQELNHLVTLTKDYYIGVFELTRLQGSHAFGQAVGSAANFATQDECEESPVNVSWAALRGASDGGETHRTPKGDSFLGQLRTKTGIAFDLPTDAQWEFACRAGTETTTYNADYLDWNFDNADAARTARTLERLNRIAWTLANATNLNANGEAVCRVQRVGLLEPNAYGLYDTLGNGWELTLDCFTQDGAYIDTFGGKGYAEPVIDPLCLSAAGATARIRRGSCATEKGGYLTARAGLRWSVPETENWAGCRLVCPVGL